MENYANFFVKVEYWFIVPAFEDHCCEEIIVSDFWFNRNLYILHIVTMFLH